MTPEERSLLERTHKLSEENNDILRSMQRMNRISSIFRIMYWVIIIGVSVGVYYYIQPFIESAFGVYKDAQGLLGDTVTSTQTITDTLGNLLN